MQVKYNDKLTEAEKTSITGIYNYNHPPVKKRVLEPPQSIVEPIIPPQRTELPPLATIGEVAAYLRVSRLTLKRWEKKGKINVIRIGDAGHRRYLREEVMRFLGEV